MNIKGPVKAVFFLVKYIQTIEGIHAVSFRKKTKSIPLDHFPVASFCSFFTPQT